MARFGNFWRQYSWLGALVVLAALSLRTLVPQGYMPDVERERIEISICTGHGAIPAQLQTPAHPTDKDATKAAKSCAYADLLLPGLPGADAVLPVTALAFALALSPAAAEPWRLVRTGKLWPPMRGPPARL